MAILTEEQTMLRDAARDWVQARSPVGAFRKLRDSGDGAGYDPALWREMGEMGWTGVIVPEAHGGSEFGYLGLGLVLEETGRTLTASPQLSTALTPASALLIGGSEAQTEEWLSQIAAGAIVAALAVDEHAHHAPEKTALTAVKSGRGWTLNGGKAFVPEGGAADLIVVAARTAGQPGDADGLTLFLVQGDADGLTRTALKTADSRGYANLTFKDVTVAETAVLGEAGGGWPILEETLDRARAGLAAEMLGTAAQAFDVTLDYLKTRTQFGQAIGTFQALQHRAAKLYTELELTRSCVEAALEAIDNGSADAGALASLAKAKAGETLHLASNEMVQMHGGVGMTDAHDAGLYLKRARAAEAIYGGASYHRDRYARLLGF